MSALASSNASALYRCIFQPRCKLAKLCRAIFIKVAPPAVAQNICIRDISTSFKPFDKQKTFRSGVQILTRQIGTKETKSCSSMSVPRSDSVKSPFVVGHDSEKKMFYVELQDKSKNKDGSVAKLEYEWVRPGLVDLYHTETPPAFQGQGIAKLLVLAGLDHFCEKDVLIRPTCTYVQKVLRENLTSVYKDHVEENYLSSLM